ncbi:hypothetical protein MMC30_009193 [Trapelia coarctata]|nr:hypothetical protein [Trapelia coarctata]
MDVVAVAASIAGVLSLAGQSINGIVQLRGFFSDVASASRTIERFLRDINSLLRVLHDVERLFSQLSASEFDGTPRTNSASLQVELEDCQRDIFEWLKLARDLRPASNRGRKSWFKRFWIGVNQASVNDIRVELERHRHSIQLNLAVIGRSLSVEASFKMSKISEQVSQVQTTSLSLDATLANQRNVLDRIERCSMTSLQSSTHSLQSLGSIANSLSKLEATSPTASGCSGSSLNGLLRSVRSQVSLNRLARNSLEDVSVGSGKRLVCECYLEPRRQAPVDGKDLHGIREKTGKNQHDQHSCRDMDAGHRTTSSCQLCGQPWSSSTLNNSANCSFVLVGHSRSYRSTVSMSLDPVAELETCDICGEEFSDEMNSLDVVSVAEDMAMGNSSSLSLQQLGCNHSSDGDIWMNPGPMPKEQLPQAPSHSVLRDDLGNQYAALLKMIEGTYPSAVGEYVLWRGMMTLFQCQLRILSSNLSVDGICEQSRDADSTKSSTVLQHRQALEASQRYNEKILGNLRSKCIKDGHSLYEIDQNLSLSTGKNSLDALREHRDMLAIRKKTLDSNLLQAWTSTRDRINSWLLHSLRSDDKLAQVHRSMLADQVLTEKEWARLTLKYWTLDEAATGVPWTPSQSVAATDSRHSPSAESLDFWTCDESIDSRDGQMMNEKLAVVKDELQMLKRQHQRKLYRGIASP